MGKEWREHDIIRYKVFISCCDRVEKCLTTESQQMRVESREEEKSVSARMTADGPAPAAAGDCAINQLKVATK